MMKRMLKALYLLGENDRKRIYSPQINKSLRQRVFFYDEPQTAQSVARNPAVLSDVEVLFSGWDAPKLTRELLDAMPNLEAVFYGAGSIRHVVTPEFWERGIRITTAVEANMIPVAEFALSQILFGLKLGWQYHQANDPLMEPSMRTFGAFGSQVGLISMGNIARLLRSYLRSHDLQVLVFDPFLSDSDAEQLDVEKVDLDTLFSQCSVISLHTPNLPETQNMIRGHHFSQMKKHATFINTARGAIVDHSEMIEVFRERADLWAVVDVVDTASAAEVEALQALPNVSLTPHIAGSVDGECFRMGQYMVEELDRYLAGEPLKYEVTEQRAAIMA